MLVDHNVHCLVDEKNNKFQFLECKNLARGWPEDVRDPGAWQKLASIATVRLSACVSPIYPLASSLDVMATDRRKSLSKNSAKLWSAGGETDGRSDKICSSQMAVSPSSEKGGQDHCQICSLLVFCSGCGTVTYKVLLIWDLLLYSRAALE